MPEDAEEVPADEENETEVTWKDLVGFLFISVFFLLYR